MFFTDVETLLVPSTRENTEVSKCEEALMAILRVRGLAARTMKKMDIGEWDGMLCSY